MPGKSVCSLSRMNQYSRELRHGFSLVEILAVVLMIGMLIGLLLPSVQMIRENARSAKCKHNLTQLSIGLISYHDAFQLYPPGTIDPKSPILNNARGYHHNWLSQMLPQLDLGILEAQIDRRYGVYHKINNPVASKPIDLFQCPSGGGALAYAAVHNDVEAPISEKNNGVFILNRQFRQRDVKDGLSNTILLGEIPGDSISWMSGSRDSLRNFGAPLQNSPMKIPASGVYYEDFDRPRETTEEAANPTNTYVGGFGSLHKFVNFALGDGSIKQVDRDISMAILRAMGNKSDGAIVDLTDFH